MYTETAGYVFEPCMIDYFFFFFKQETAYDLRISDWSSDVCSSDLPPNAAPSPERRCRAPPQAPNADRLTGHVAAKLHHPGRLCRVAGGAPPALRPGAPEDGGGGVMGGGQWRPIREWRLHLRPQAAARDRPRAEPAGKAHEGCAGGGPAPPARQAARLLRSDSDRGGRGRPGKRLHAGGRGRGGRRRRTDKLEHADCQSVARRGGGRSAHRPASGRSEGA